MKKPWLHNGKKMRVLCEECPCDVKCNDFYYLKNQAIANNWEFHEEGVLVTLAENGSGGYAGWYARQYTPCVCCAFGNNHCYYVQCGCENAHQSQYWIRSIDLSNKPQGYCLWIDYSGACECIDERELLLTYPDLFGVVDVSYGSHTKFRYSDDGGIVIHSAWGDTAYLDYRTIIFILYVYENGVQKMQIRGISPAGSPVEELSRESHSTHTLIEFEGHLVPFEQFSWDYPSRNRWFLTSRVTWNADQFRKRQGCYNTLQEAEDALASAVPDPYPGYGCGFTACYFPDRISPPNTEPVLHEGNIYEDSTKWCVNWPYYTMGNEYDCNNVTRYIMYNEVWLQTNRGILVIGGSTYLDELTIYGLKDGHGDPDWGGGLCAAYAPLHDETMAATYVDEDMHFCHQDFTIPEED